MIEVQQNRYLWIHFAAMAIVPLLLDICLAGLASAGPAFDYPGAFGLQFWAIALFGIVPSLWMQIAKPFYMFSLPPVALKPSVLTEDQRRCLTALKSWQMKVLAGVTAGLLLWTLTWLYAESPRVLPTMTPTVGLINAAVSFFFVCLFFQISAAAARAILVSPTALKRVAAYEESAIAADFLILGIRVKSLLPTAASLTAQIVSPLPNVPVSGKPLVADPVAEASIAEPPTVEPIASSPESDVDDANPA